jgi:alpha-L-rhamnosidase
MPYSTSTDTKLPDHLRLDWKDSRWIGLGTVQADDLHPIRSALWLRPALTERYSILGIACDFELPDSSVRKASLSWVNQGRSGPWTWKRPWIVVNGQHQPQWCDHWDFHSVITYDISAELNIGSNRVSLRTFADDEAALIALIEVVLEDGRTLSWASDATWTTRAWTDETDEPDWHQGPEWMPSLVVGSWGKGPWHPEHWRNRVAQRRATALLRRRFSLDRPALRSRIIASACGIYRAHLDNQRIGNDELAPGLTEYHSRIDAQSYELGSLGAGEHILSVELADGWFAGRIFLGNMAWGPEASFRAVLQVEYEDGSQMYLSTNELWEGSTGACRAASFFEGEIRDLTRSAGPWVPVRLLNPDVPLPTLATHPPIRILSERKANKIIKRKNDRWLIDLGQNLAGRLRLRVITQAKAVVTVRHAEVLSLDGSLYTEALRSATSTDTYTCPGGEIELEPVFTQLGFRFAEVIGADEVIDATALILGNDLQPTGEFSCEDERLNRFLACISWGALSNAIGIPTDCPQRDERAGWSDAQGQWPTWCLLRDHRDFFASFVDAWFALQREDGYLPDYAPQPIPLTPANRSRYAWGCTGIELPHLLWKQYGFLDPARRHWEGLCRYMEHRQNSDPENDNGWNFGDWLCRGEMTPHPLINTAWYIMTLQQAAELGQALGRLADSVEYARRAREYSSRWQKRWIVDGHLTHASQTAAVVALHVGLIPPSQISGILDDLVASCFKDGLTTGFLGAGRILQVLHDHGRYDAAWHLATLETQPSWLAMLKCDATTLWERWDGYSPTLGPLNTGGMNSYNHASFGAYGAWLFRVAGLQQAPSDVGWRRVRCVPSPGRLSFAEASYLCDQGRWHSRWDCSGGQFTLRLTIPPDCQAEVLLPGQTKWILLESGNHTLKSNVKSPSFIPN